MRAHLGAEGFAVPNGDDAGAAWALVGSGEMPAWCSGRTDLRCERLAAGAEGLPDGAIPFSWLAGAWPVGSAVPRDVQAPGAAGLCGDGVTGFRRGSPRRTGHSSWRSGSCGNDAIPSKPSAVGAEPSRGRYAVPNSQSQAARLIVASCHVAGYPEESPM